MIIIGPKESWTSLQDRLRASYLNHENKFNHFFYEPQKSSLTIWIQVYQQKDGNLL